MTWAALVGVSLFICYLRLSSPTYRAKRAARRQQMDDYRRVTEGWRS